MLHKVRRSMRVMTRMVQVNTLRMTVSQVSCAAQSEEDHDSDERDGRYR